MAHHLYPVNDLRDHITDIKLGMCWCKPDVEYEGAETIYIHNSMDGREKYETGERKVS